MKKKTTDELLAQAEAAEKRAKELRAQAKKQTEAEQKKINADIIKAVKEWQDGLDEKDRTDWADLPEVFRQAGADKKILGGGGNDWWNEYSEQRDLITRLMAIMNKDYYNFEQYVQWREQQAQQKQQAKADGQA